jgi:uncharacterized membrane protein (UPF0136 family)
MTWLKVIIILYAILNIGGGIEGFIAKHSIPSIAAGSTFGILLLVGVFLAGSNAKLGYGICAFVALGNLGFFTQQLSKGKGFWPAGVMVIASCLTLGCLLAAHFMNKAPVSTSSSSSASE